MASGITFQEMPERATLKYAQLAISGHRIKCRLRRHQGRGRGHYLQSSRYLRQLPMPSSPNSSL
jgi:hypothetical protein